MTTEERWFEMYGDKAIQHYKKTIEGEKGRMLTRKQLRNMLELTESDIKTMRKRITEYDAEGVGAIARDIESRMGSIVADMEIEGIAVAMQVGHNGGDSPIEDLS